MDTIGVILIIAGTVVIAFVVLLYHFFKHNLEMEEHLDSHRDE